MQEPLEITALPIAEAQAVADMKTLGYDAQSRAAQVRLADLKPQPLPIARVDYTSGLVFTLQPFVADTAEVFVNGLRNTPSLDYRELTDAATSLSHGIEIHGIDSTDRLTIRAIPAGQ